MQADATAKCSLRSALKETRPHFLHRGLVQGSRGCSSRRNVSEKSIGGVVSQGGWGRHLGSRGAVTACQRPGNARQAVNRMFVRSSGAWLPGSETVYTCGLASLCEVFLSDGSLCFAFLLLGCQQGARSGGGGAGVSFCVKHCIGDGVWG